MISIIYKIRQQNCRKIKWNWLELNFLKLLPALIEIFNVWVLCLPFDYFRKSIKINSYCVSQYIWWYITYQGALWSIQSKYHCIFTTLNTGIVK